MDAGGSGGGRQDGGGQGGGCWSLLASAKLSKARHRTAEQLSSLQEQRGGRRAGTSSMSRQTPAHCEGRASSRTCWNRSVIEAGRKG